MALRISQGDNPISTLFPLLLLGLPIFDTLSIMFGRMVKGRFSFVADKNHLHHKLLKLVSSTMDDDVLPDVIIKVPRTFFSGMKAGVVL
jgi:UDP-N-acetylmuramyl pentapeptide phosphotransferase/UDP-N-acetylglucosamine-1-phosphate transferase